MHIRRIQVEEGFLEGADISFSDGLNTIIGARGTGKTSVLELIRYCLGAPSFTQESSKISYDHALAILGGGQVTVTLQDKEGEVIVTRGGGSGSSNVPRSSGFFEAPLIMSQTEVESVGLHSGGRLSLIDSFIARSKNVSQQEGALVGEIKSTTSQLESLLRDKQDLDEKLSGLKKIDEALLGLAEKEKAIASFSEAVSIKKTNLDLISNQTTKLSIADSYVDRYKNSLTDGLIAIHKGLTSLFSREGWQGQDASPVENIEKSVNANYFKLVEAYSEIRALLSQIDADKVARQGLKVNFENEAREIRREIDQVMEGAGAIARESAALRDSREQLLSLSVLQKNIVDKVSELKKKRSADLDKLDEIRNSKFELRKLVCDRINLKLYPKIKIEIERASQVGEYARILSETLKGSGLRYVEIAKTIAQLLSPRELMEAVDSYDHEYISDITGIAKDRAAKALIHLRDVGVGDICTCLVDDEVSFYLLDGVEFKDLSRLSTGQRCTVVLPILLEHEDRVLLVDQPEDHIDNAFITDTLIKAIRGRSKQSQIIFTTHNANIPVLGNADKVIHMASDGKRGHVLLAESLEHVGAINAISNVMEGGADAFKYRATFYEKGIDNAG